MLLAPDTYQTAIFDSDGHVTFPRGLEIPQDQDGPPPTTEIDSEHAVQWTALTGSVVGQIANFRQGTDQLGSQGWYRVLDQVGARIASLDLIASNVITAVLASASLGGIGPIRKIIDRNSASDFVQVSSGGAGWSTQRLMIHQAIVSYAMPGGVSTLAIPAVGGGNHGALPMHFAPAAHWDYDWFPRSTEIVFNNRGAAQNITVNVAILHVPA